MGCDIHSRAEVRRNGQWEVVGDIFPYDEFDIRWHKKTHGNEPFDWRNYGMFGFLADVRNYSHVPCVQKPTHEIPSDCSPEVRQMFSEEYDYHSINCITLRTLLDFDYDQTFWDRRVTKQISPNFWDGAALAEKGEGRHLTVREFLGERFFEEISILESLGPPDDVRIVFGFDN